MKKTKVKSNIKEKVIWIKRVGFMVMLHFFITVQPVYAAATVTSSMSNLTDIVKAFVSAVGAIIVLWGLFEWGNAMQSNDGMMQSMAFKRIGGGIVMTIGPQIFLTLVIS